MKQACICYHVPAFVILFNLIWNMTMFWKRWIFVRGRGLQVKIFASMLLHASFSLTWYTTWPCSERFEFWPHPKGQGVVVKGVCRQNICYHAAAFVILLNFIWNMTMFWKKWIFTFWPISPGLGRGGGCGWGLCRQIFATMLLHSRLHLIWYETCPCSEKLEFWHFDSTPGLGEGVDEGVCTQNMCCCIHDFS